MGIWEVLENDSRLNFSKPKFIIFQILKMLVCGVTSTYARRFETQMSAHKRPLAYFTCSYF